MDTDEKIEFAIDLAGKLSKDPELRKIVAHALKHTLLPWDDRPGNPVRYSERMNLAGDIEVHTSSVDRITTLDKANIDEKCREAGYILIND